MLRTIHVTTRPEGFQLQLDPVSTLQVRRQLKYRSIFLVIVHKMVHNVEI